MNNRTTLEQLDESWELAVMRNTRIQTAILFLIRDRVNLLQALSHKTLEEVG